MRAVFHLFPSQHFCSFPTGETGILCDIVIYLSSASGEYFSTAGAAGGSTRGNEFLVAARTNPTFQTSVYPACAIDLIAAANGAYLRVISVQEGIRAASGADVGSGIFFYPHRQLHQPLTAGGAYVGNFAVWKSEFCVTGTAVPERSPMT